jgi:quinolinate synthase
MEKIYRCLKNEKPEIYVNKEIIIKAKKPIIRMLDISEKLGL